MEAIRALLVALLFCVPALGDEKELFDPSKNPGKTWLHYTETYFPDLEGTHPVLHVVSVPALQENARCLSLVKRTRENGIEHFLHLRELTRDGSGELETHDVAVDNSFAFRLENLISLALQFTRETPAPPTKLDGKSTLFFVDDYWKRLGIAHAPDKASVPGRLVRITEELRSDVESGSFDGERWLQRVEKLKAGLPELKWSPVYSETQGDSLLEEQLDALAEWKLLHQVRHMRVDGFDDAESLHFRKDLAKSLAETAPKEWSDLMKSSGNMHNPKVDPIHPFIDDATIQTPTVIRLNELLSGYDLQIVGLVFEKLSFATKTGGGVPSAMMDFKIESIPPSPPNAIEPHPDAVPNSHAPGEVDVEANVEYIVPDPSELEGIVLDETDAVLVGEWQYSTHTPPYVGIGYLHDRKSGKGEKSVTWHPEFPEAGRYEVRIAHCYNVRRATKTPVTIRHAGGETTVRINQQEVPEHGKLFRSLGVFEFGEGSSGSITISNDGTEEAKVVIADAVWFYPIH